MIKTNPLSRFVLLSLEDIRDTSYVVLQTEKTYSTFADSKKDAYLCEVVKQSDFDRTETVEKLAAELAIVNDDNRALRKKVERLEKVLQKERASHE